mgnify:CR=1 FL=1|tara:strand:- start:8351 stop:9130 length:780 start_codon:yes stop_codon:yes gene_type:complete
MDKFSKTFLMGASAAILIVGFRMFRGEEMTPRAGMTETVTKEASGCGCSGGYENQEVQNAQDGGVTFKSEYSLEYINPEPVSGANDVHGAENTGFVSRGQTSTSHGRGFASDTVATKQMASIMEGASPTLAPGQRYVPNATMNVGTDCRIGHAYNDLCPQCSGPGGKSASIPVRVPPPYNPTSYQTLSGLVHDRPISPDSPQGSGTGGGYSGDMMSMAGMPYDNANDFLPEYRFPWPWSPAYNPVSPGRQDDYRMIRTY